MNFEEEAVAKRMNKKVTMTKKRQLFVYFASLLKITTFIIVTTQEKLLFNSNNKNSMRKTCEYTELKISILVSLHVASVLIFDVSPPLSE